MTSMAAVNVSMTAGSPPGTVHVTTTVHPGDMTTELPVATVVGTSVAALALVIAGAVLFFIYRKKHFPRTHFHRNLPRQNTQEDTCWSSKKKNSYPNMGVRNDVQCNHDLCLQLEETLENSENYGGTDGASKNNKKPLKSILKKSGSDPINSSSLHSNKEESQTASSKDDVICHGQTTCGRSQNTSRCKNQDRKPPDLESKAESKSSDQCHRNCSNHPAQPNIYVISNTSAADDERQIPDDLVASL